MTDYTDALAAFVEGMNAAVLPKLKTYDDITVYGLEFHPDGYAAFDGDGYVDIPGTVISSDDWIDGEIESEYITVPTPCSKDDYLRICQEITDRSLWYEQYAAKFMRAKYKLEEYILEFAKKLKSEWAIFENVSLSGLPIYITGNDIKDNSGGYSLEANGMYKPAFNLITIYNFEPDETDRNERTARHEIIHYFLMSAGLPYDDNSGYFWYFATIYDAHPYEKMDEDNKKLFDLLIRMNKEELQTALKESIKIFNHKTE